MNFYDTPYLLALHQRFANLKQRSYQLLDAKPGQTVVDMGCGLGLDAVALAATGARVIGVEPNESFLTQARQLHGGIVEFHCCLAHATGLESNSADALRFDRVLQHIADQEPVLIEAHRVLKPGGRLQVVDTDWQSMSLFLPDIALERKLVDAVSGHAVGNSLLRQLPERLAQHGFTDVTMEAHSMLAKDFSTMDSVVHRIVDYEIAAEYLTAAEEATWVQWKASGQRWLSQNFLLIQATKR